jgi:PLP dependent protein
MSEREGSQRERGALSEREGSQRERGALSEREGSQREQGAPPAAAPDARTAVLAANLAALRRRIATACASAGRDPAELTLIAVTKTFPAEDVLRLLALGVPDIGENRDQEARAKAAAVPQARWHFVGRLQRNKCRSLARYASVVHSVDRLELVPALDDGVRRAGRDRLDVLVQVGFDRVPGRGGARPADVPALADAVAGTVALRLRGVMTIAPLGEDPVPAFADLAAIAARLRADHPHATVISAGMSGDLEQAIQHGATHLRVGTALLGGRPLLLG